MKLYQPEQIRNGAQYREWLVKWRSQYQLISAMIRALKDSSAQYHATGRIQSGQSVQRTLVTLRKEAGSLMELRHQVERSKPTMIKKNPPQPQNVIDLFSLAINSQEDVNRWYKEWRIVNNFISQRLNDTKKYQASLHRQGDYEVLRWFQSKGTPALVDLANSLKSMRSEQDYYTKEYGFRIP